MTPGEPAPTWPPIIAPPPVSIASPPAIIEMRKPMTMAQITTTAVYPIDFSAGFFMSRGRPR